MLTKVNTETMKSFIMNADTEYSKFHTIITKEMYVDTNDEKTKCLLNTMEERLTERAENLIKSLDERLEDTICSYCKDGKEKDFSFTHNNETFSIFEIKAMRNCNYYTAVMLMNEFINDPEKGRLLIMRR